ncbi:hypothetical protein BP5796_12369 [Coleophoma crateriformis]|uniref:Apple domain-containing protein n=1 Tax=Coleophoma crateriformis TaxID=565419 RepID=A0A3D8Q9G4_9HELO|nr:hypothetical protein BP5796_12369 [Coleophoma crateriformis]
MKSLYILSTLAVLATANPLLQDRDTCNADNCARAITRTTKPALASRMADCTSFLLATVTPAVVTLTTIVTPDPSSVTTTVVEVTTTTTTTTAGAVKKRINTNGAITNSPSAVPTYASACSGTTRYSSACSCAGVTKSTTTLIAVTVYTTVLAIVSTTTGTTTSTSTTTTTTTTASAPLPTSNVEGEGECPCQYNINHSEVQIIINGVHVSVDGDDLITSTSAQSVKDCLDICSSYKNCLVADFTHLSRQCRIYRGDVVFTLSPSSDVDTITRVGCGDTKVSGCITG